VDPTTFLRVVSAIESDRIQVSPDVEPGHGGQYDTTQVNGGTFYARPTRNRRIERSYVIHEAVHASFDITRSTIAGVDNEAACFLAQFVYLRISCYPISRVHSDNANVTRLYEILWQTAGSIQNGGSVPDARIEEIRQKIMLHPNYRDLRMEGCVSGEPECFVLFGANG
jgi:hypothetical protein